MLQTTLNIKPLSINQAWRSSCPRYRTKEYIQYERDLLLLLPKLNIPDGKLEIQYLWGLSSKLADVDSPIKQFQDILQKAYGFNDRRIYRIIVQKKDVEKNHEFISFTIGKFHE